MSNFMEKTFEHFLERINAEAVAQRGGGKAMIDSMAIRRIVREEPETTKFVIQAYSVGAQANPVLFQMAYSLATAYQIEFGDDQFVKQVTTAMNKAGIDLEFQGGDSGLPLQVGTRKRTTHATIPATCGSAAASRGLWSKLRGIFKPRSTRSQMPCETASRSYTSMSNGDAIRMLNVVDEDLRTGNIATFRRIFKGIEASPEKAQAIQGSVVVGFPQYDDDPRANHMIPEIREFIKNLDKEFIYFMYYIVSSREVGAAMFYAMCLLPLQHFTVSLGQWQYVGSESELINILAARMQAVYDFAKKMYDDPEPIIHGLLGNFPSAVSAAVRQRVHK